MELLRIVTAGSVDDGKSTLIGRLLYDTKSLKEDQLDHIVKKSKRKGMDYIDFSLATDGLLTEREQGITIDISNIFFKTKKRRFVIADAPGHVEYTRNMVTGASNANVAIVLIDARKGVLEQTQRHFYITQLLGICNLIFVINKMDLVDYDFTHFKNIEKDIQHLAKDYTSNYHLLPVSALKGDNITSASVNTPWYHGPALLDLIESIEVADSKHQESVFQVQLVIRPQLEEHHDYRGFAGKVNSGRFQVGDEIAVFPSGIKSKIKQIERYGKPTKTLNENENGTLILVDDIDLSRGSSILTLSTEKHLKKSNQIDARVCWMQNQELNPNLKYILQQGVQQVQSKIILQESSVQGLKLNEIGVVHFRLSEQILNKPFVENNKIGRFILIDPHTNNTAAVGFIQ